jgi:hypothetical protein
MVTRAGRGTVLDPGARRTGPARRRLPGQLARHLPELGSAGRQRAGLPGLNGGGLPGRDDARRLQPLPHQPRRHRLGGGGARQPLELHRLLGRPPGGLPAEAAGGDCRRTARPAGRRCGTGHCSALPTCPTGSSRMPSRPPHPKATIHFDHDGAPARPAAQGDGRRRPAGVRRRRPAGAGHAGREAGHHRAGQGRQPGARRRPVAAHPAAGVERRQQRAGGQRPVGGDAGAPAALPGLHRRTAGADAPFALSAATLQALHRAAALLRATPSR